MDYLNRKNVNLYFIQFKSGCLGDEQPDEDEGDGREPAVQEEGA